MSHAAVAAVLARHDLSAGERLVAWSLASFANRDQWAWPGIPAATARAGLSRSRYLELRDGLVCRGLLEIETPGVGRGHASTVKLLFAQSGPWQEGEVNPNCLRPCSAIAGSRTCKAALAALASLADENGSVEGLTTDELCRVAGLAKSTYRRARAALLASEEVSVEGDIGGRGRTCHWTVRPATELTTKPVVETEAASSSAPRCAPARSSGDVGRRKRSDPERSFRRKGSDRERGYRCKTSEPERGFRNGSEPERGF